MKRQGTSALIVIVVGTRHSCDTTDTVVVVFRLSYLCVYMCGHMSTCEYMCVYEYKGTWVYKHLYGVT